MATDAGASISDTAILSRLTFPEGDGITPELARGLLAIRFNEVDLARIKELLSKNSEGEWTSLEQTEMENYRRVSFLLDLMHAKARRALKSASSSSPN